MTLHGSDNVPADSDSAGNNALKGRLKLMIKPIVTKATNAKFIAEGFGDLPGTVAHDENGVPYIISAWEIEPEDLKKLNETGIIYLSVVGQTIPPVLLEVNNPMQAEEGAEGDNH